MSEARRLPERTDNRQFTPEKVATFIEASLLFVKNDVRSRELRPTGGKGPMRVLEVFAGDKYVATVTIDGEGLDYLGDVEPAFCYHVRGGAKAVREGMCASCVSTDTSTEPECNGSNDGTCPKHPEVNV